MSPHDRHFLNDLRGVTVRSSVALAMLAVAFGAAALALATGAARLGQPPDGTLLPWWGLVPVFCAAEWYALGARGRSRLAALSSHDATVVLGLFLAGP